MSSKNKFLTALAVVGMLSSASANALVINLNNTGGVETGTNALYGFTVASKFWESVLLDDVSVNLNVGFSSLRPGVLGSTGSTSSVVLVDDMITALDADRTSILDFNTVLPTTVDSIYSYADGSAAGAVNAIISAATTDGSGVELPLTRELDADGSANNTFLDVNTAVLKATGLLADDGSADGNITFSSDFSFDFDPTNGIDSTSFDFIGVAIHEIGHALGFVSGVDLYDIIPGIPGAYYLDNYAIFSSLDLFRYSADSALSGVLDWAIDDAAYLSEFSPYFSIDGGVSAFSADSGEGYFSTGRNEGDGQQASHWKDLDPTLGLLDPNVARGVGTAISALDLAAFDAMGWDVAVDVFNDRSISFSGQDLFGVTSVSAPATLSFIAMSLVWFGVSARKRHQQ